MCANLTLEDDEVHEQHETFLVSLTSSDPAVDTQNSQGIATIVDNDGKQLLHTNFTLC